jgi:hypothetical protein
VAGQLVVKVKRRGDLKNWAEELRRRLETATVYNAYEKVFDDVLAEVKAKEPGTKKNEYWPEDWLGEFFEDLYGVNVVGSAMIETLAEALARHYHEQDADQDHPPTGLRLAVALNFLEETEREAIRNKLEQRYGPNPLGLDKFRQDEALSQVVQEISTFCQYKFGEFDNPDLSGAENFLTGVFRSLVDTFFAANDQAVAPAGSPDRFADLPDLRPGGTFEPQPDTLWLQTPVNGQDIAIFFPNGISAAAKSVITNQAFLTQLLAEVETLAKSAGAPEAKITADREINGHQCQVTAPTAPQPVVAIVVEDPAGTQLFINDLDALFKLRFAEADRCCPWWGG